VKGRPTIPAAVVDQIKCAVKGPLELHPLEGAVTPRQALGKKHALANSERAASRLWRE
jgi:hypothetical protein